MASPAPIEIRDDASELLALLDGRGRMRLVSTGTRRRFGKGTVLMREGAPDEHTFYLILFGKVRVDARTAAGGTETMGEYKEGAIVGEIAALLFERRTATVTAESDLELLAFEAEPALEILADYPKAMQALTALAERRKARRP